MKHLVHFLFASLLVLLSGCNDRRPGEPTVGDLPSASSDASVAPSDTTAHSGSFAEEREQYRYRINRRLTELEGEIEEARTRRQAEKNQIKSREYDTRIEERERSRKTFQERLDKLEEQTETGWQNFKAEMDDLFNRDKGSDSLRTIK